MAFTRSTVDNGTILIFCRRKALQRRTEVRPRLTPPGLTQPLGVRGRQNQGLPNGSGRPTQISVDSSYAP